MRASGLLEYFLAGFAMVQSWLVAFEDPKRARRAKKPHLTALKSLTAARETTSVTELSCNFTDDARLHWLRLRSAHMRRLPRLIRLRRDVLPRASTMQPPRRSGDLVHTLDERKQLWRMLSRLRFHRRTTSTENMRALRERNTRPNAIPCARRR